MRMPLGMQLFNYVIVVLASLCYTLINENIRVDKMQKEKENEALRTELTFLRWQISPHFLFNVLNNMVALARVRSEKLEKSLLNLSSLMRYMLYETDEQKVSIEREAEYLQSYIDLQNLRFGNEVKVLSEIYVSEKTNNSHVIEPMLLIPFIENAYKHGIGNITEPIIDIYVHFENDMLTMTVKNKFLPESSAKKDDAQGIGLANVKRRLNLLYPQKHSLGITTINGWYISTLGINLS
jgi:LytS/YehU family sensor histidine kinase